VNTLTNAAEAANNVLFGGLRNHLRDVLDCRASFSVAGLLPTADITRVLQGIANISIDGINAALGLPWRIPQDTIFLGVFNIPAGSLLTAGRIPRFPGYNLSWSPPDLAQMCADASSLDPDHLDRRNHFITFQDVDGDQAGAIKAESLKDWKDNVLLSPSFLAKVASNFVGVDPLKAVAKTTQNLGEELVKLRKMGVVYSSGNGDYAEWLERVNPNERITPGDVVGVRAGKISRDLTDAEQIMVVSHNPIVRGNAPNAKIERLGNDVAFVGQVPVKVMGAVASGDFIVASDDVPGWAVAVNPQEMQTSDYAHAVGRSWDSHPEDGPKYVNTVVGVHNMEWVRKVDELEQQQRANTDRIQRLETALHQTLGIDLHQRDEQTQP
jgi:hypothetical protein